jgi:hypothetical protein
MRTRYKTKEWARLAMKFGLLLTDAKLWKAMNEQLRERSEDLSEVVRREYEDTTDRLVDARRALQGQSDWFARVASLLAGLGVGVGLGLLLAPASGAETRAALRDKAVDVKNNVGDIAARATRLRPTPTGASPTGTTGD